MLRWLQLHARPFTTRTTRTGFDTFKPVRTVCGNWNFPKISRHAYRVPRTVIADAKNRRSVDFFFNFLHVWRSAGSIRVTFHFHAIAELRSSKLSAFVSAVRHCASLIDICHWLRSDKSEILQFGFGSRDGLNFIVGQR